MGVEITGSEQSKDQVVTEMADVEVESGAVVESKPLVAVSADEKHASVDVALNGVMNGSLKSEEQKQEASADNGVPKDVKDEWPMPLETRLFYFPKIRPFEDPKLRAKMDQAEKDKKKKFDARFDIIEKLKAKRSQRSEILDKLRPLADEERAYRKQLGEQKTAMEPYRQDLQKFRNANNAAREKAQGLCSSEEELNRRIQTLQFNIEHENNTLNEEKKMIREIKQLEGTRAEVIAQAATREKLQKSMAENLEIENQFKNGKSGLDATREKQQDAWNRKKPLEEELRAVEAQIAALQEQLTVATEKKDIALDASRKLREERDAVNHQFVQYRSLIAKANELSYKKDVVALGELAATESEKFMSAWNSMKEFREDYQKRQLQSLAYRNLCKDGRLRNPDEAPVVVPETKVEAKKPIEEPTKELPPKKTTVQATPAPTENHKPVIEVAKAQKPARSLPKREVETEVAEQVVVRSRETPNIDNEAEALRLKEKRREEEIAKAKLAQERKKKQAEKAQAKAALKAQKEAEKKQKEREKKLRKKAGVGASGQEPEATEAAAVETVLEEEVTGLAEDVPSELNEKPRQRRKEVPVKSKVKPPFPKSVLKKKRSFPTWAWVAIVVALLLVLAVVGYFKVL